MKYFVYLIFGTIVFLLMRKVINRVFPKLKRATNLLFSGILAIGLSPILAKCAFVIFFNLILYEYHPSRSFTVESWQENTRDRHEMAEDLIKSKALIDKTKNQITEKIGLPVNKIDLENDTISKWRYNMGNRGWGFGHKFFYLNIEFENSRSKSVIIKESID